MNKLQNKLGVQFMFTDHKEDNICENINICPNNPIEKSAHALLKIHQLIEVRYGGNVDKTKEFCSIAYDVQDKRFIVRSCYNVIYDNVAVCFNSKELAEEFLLYKENIELLKDCFIL